MFHVWCALFGNMLIIEVPYSGILSSEKTFVNFADFRPSAKVFSAKFGAWRT